MLNLNDAKSSKNSNTEVTKNYSNTSAMDAFRRLASSFLVRK